MHIDRVTLEAERFPTREKYPFNLQTLTCTPEIVFEAPLTFFVGENGTGKSTLLRALTRRCGVHIWANPDCHHVEVNPHEEELRRYLDVKWVVGPVPGSFFSSEHFRYFSERVEDWAGSDGALFQYFGESRYWLSLMGSRSCRSSPPVIGCKVSFSLTNPRPPSLPAASSICFVCFLK